MSLTVLPALIFSFTSSAVTLRLSFTREGRKYPSILAFNAVAIRVELDSKAGTYSALIVILESIFISANDESILLLRFLLSLTVSYTNPSMPSYIPVLAFKPLATGTVIKPAIRIQAIRVTMENNILNNPLKAPFIPKSANTIITTISTGFIASP